MNFLLTAWNVCPAGLGLDGMPYVQVFDGGYGLAGRRGCVPAQHTIPFLWPCTLAFQRNAWQQNVKYHGIAPRECMLTGGLAAMGGRGFQEDAMGPEGGARLDSAKFLRRLLDAALHLTNAPRDPDVLRNTLGEVIHQPGHLGSNPA